MVKLELSSIERPVKGADIVTKPGSTYIASIVRFCAPQTSLYVARTTSCQAQWVVKSAVSKEYQLEEGCF